MTTALHFLIALMLVSAPVRAIEPELSAQDILAKMHQAMAALNYQGTVAFLKNDRLEPMKYAHAAALGVQQERLQSLNSPLREIVRDTDKVSCIFKDSQHITLDYRPFEHSFLVDVPNDLDAASNSYQFERLGEENIAMLDTYVVAIIPKDQARYPRRIWVEKQQFLPLKAVLYDHTGKALEQWMFTDFAVKDNIPFVTVNSPAATLPLQDSSTAPTHAAFEVTALPLGFSEIYFTQQHLHPSEPPVDHLLLSDGFTTVSVYMEHTRVGMPSGLKALGAVNAYSRSLNNYPVTVMGEVPVETVKLIADGIKLKE